MKCPLCGQPGKILETRINEDDSKRRRYSCPKDHRFTTREVISKDTVHTEQKSTKNRGSHELSEVWFPSRTGRTL
jgi:transcriptional regulator NrdR family protein